jgi:hypothetical protein
VLWNDTVASYVDAITRVLQPGAPSRRHAPSMACNEIIR